jgi:hypothetical protein
LLAGNAQAATDHDHLGETWSGDPSGAGLTLDVTGSNDGLEAETVDGFGLRGIATGSSGAGIGVLGYTAASTGEAVYAEAGASSGEATGVFGAAYSPDGYGVYGRNGSSGGYGVYSDGDLHVEGDFTASGTKNFVQTVETPAGPKDIAYTAVEADRAQTETTGVVELDDGRAEIDLPEHFGLVTSTDEDPVVQLTPYTVDTEGVAVTERSTDRIVVETIDGEGDFEFSYTVRGVREGYEDEQVIQGEK